MINWHKLWSCKDISTSCLLCASQRNKNGIKIFSAFALQTKDFQQVLARTVPTPFFFYHIILLRILVLFSPASSSLVPASGSVSQETETMRQETAALYGMGYYITQLNVFHKESNSNWFQAGPMETPISGQGVLIVLPELILAPVSRQGIHCSLCGCSAAGPTACRGCWSIPFNNAAPIGTQM